MIQPIDKGGVQAVDIRTQSIALKFSMLNRTCYDNEQFWCLHLQSLFKIPLQEVLVANLKYADLNKLFRNKSKVPAYWRDVFKQWCHFHFRGSNADISKDSLAKMKFKFNSVLKCRCYHSNVLRSYDILDSMGIVTMQHLFNDALCAPVGGSTRKLLLCCRIKTPPEWKDMLVDYSGVPLHHPLFQFADWAYDKISAKGIYDALISLRSYDNHTVIHSWQRELDNYSLAEKWKCISNRVRSLKYSKHKSFHILFLNRALFPYKTKFGICPFCGQSGARYIHVFYDCEKIREIWIYILNKVNFSQMPVLNTVLGYKCSKPIFRMCVAAKYYRGGSRGGPPPP